MNLKQLYDDFLEKGELKTFMPASTGEWDKDKYEFKEIYLLLTTSTIDTDEDEEDYI